MTKKQKKQKRRGGHSPIVLPPPSEPVTTPAPKMARTRFNYVLPVHLHDLLRKAAYESNRPMAHIMDEALEDWAAKNGEKSW